VRDGHGINEGWAKDRQGRMRDRIWARKGWEGDGRVMGDRREGDGRGMGKGDG
jgi:hypothetical protein